MKKGALLGYEGITRDNEGQRGIVLISRRAFAHIVPVGAAVGELVGELVGAQVGDVVRRSKDW